jgi:predicted phage baseplate assembly protein
VPLPAPNLDDRRFQELVDEAKRLVQQRCPEWTDHNVSDPGVTLIETFATMVDQLLYRLNRVPDRLYVKFLDLLGVRMFPPTAARTDVTFWLSAPQPDKVKIPEGTEVATVRTETDEAISFRVVKNLDIVPSTLTRLATTSEGARVVDRSDTINSQATFFSFGQTPTPGDALLIGLSVPVPACAVLLRFECDVEGVGVDPKRPPLAWEAWNGEAWVACGIDRDETGGLNRSGDVVLHVPATHEAYLIAGRRAGWLRCRVVPAEPGQPVYSASPRILSLTAATVGGTTAAINGEVVEGEIVGKSEGVPGQRFSLRRRPVVPGDDPPVLEVSLGEGWEPWKVVESFAGSGPDDPHFFLEEVAGEVVLGPAVREPDGSLRQYGRLPPAGALLRLRSYRTGGGRRGNVAAGAISVLKSSIPYITRVENRERASSGVDGESLEEAKIRGPVLLASRERAVTVDDYEQLARRAAPEVARVRCAPAEEPTEAGGVRILVVPAVSEDELGRLVFDQLVPAEETLQKIKTFLGERRMVGARVLVEPPEYQGVTVVAQLRSRPRTTPQRLQNDAMEALYRYFGPVTGGPDGKGWPFGRPVHIGDVYAVLQRVPGTELVEDARLFAANPATGERNQQPVQRIELGAHTLVFSYEHQIQVQEG